MRFYIRSFLALVVMLFYPIPLIIHMIPLCSTPSPSSKYYLEVPIDNPMVCDIIMNIGSKDNVFDINGANVD